MLTDDGCDLQEKDHKSSPSASSSAQRRPRKRTLPQSELCTAPSPSAKVQRAFISSSSSGSHASPALSSLNNSNTLKNNSSNSSNHNKNNSNNLKNNNNSNNNSNNVKKNNNSNNNLTHSNNNFSVAATSTSSFPSASSPASPQMYPQDTIPEHLPPITRLLHMLHTERLRRNPKHHQWIQRTD